MRIKHRNLHLDFEKCNVFSFGMLLLCMATLYNPTLLYRNLYDLDYNTVQVLLSKMGSMYSKDIYLIAKGCL